MEKVRAVLKSTRIILSNRNTLGFKTDDPVTFQKRSQTYRLKPLDPIRSTLPKAGFHSFSTGSAVDYVHLAASQATRKCEDCRINGSSFDK
ncbi:MAG: hypothetical protein ACQEQ7_07845, partial [Thermodesulfobacteriota bacterium]